MTNMYLKGYMSKEADPFSLSALIGGLTLKKILGGAAIASVFTVPRFLGGKGSADYQKLQDAQALAQLRQSRMMGGAGLGASLGGLAGYTLSDEDEKHKWALKGALLGGGAGTLAGLASSLQQNV